MRNLVRNFAIQSRLFIIVLQGFFNVLIPDHDAKVFNPPVVIEKLADRLINTVFGGFRRWDAVYFLHIAEHGYSYENTLAFFPLFPLLVRIVANTICYPLQYYASYANVLLVAAVLVNLFCFVASAVVLFELGKLVLRNEHIAFRSAQLYCVNPASIFFSAAYSESSFALFAWLGMLLVEQNRMTSAAFLFALSGATRSNGLVNAGFIIHHLLTSVYQIVSQQKGRTIVILSNVMYITLLTVFRIVVVFMPFMLYQYYAFTVFCNPLASYRDLPTDVRRYGSEQGYKMPYTGLSVWCDKRIPLSYSYVQSNHWNVGLLKYYELKQVPNFILATPMTCLVLRAIWLMLSKHWTHCLWLGIKTVKEVDAKVKKSDDVKEDELSDRCLPVSCFVYLVHVGFLLIFGVLCMHVQVITRFIASSSPIIYWFVAFITMPTRTDQGAQQQPAKSLDEPQSPVRKKPFFQSSAVSADILNWDTSLLSRLIIVYFHLYLFVGTASFANFLPWT